MRVAAQHAPGVDDADLAEQFAAIRRASARHLPTPRNRRIGWVSW